MSDLIEFEKVPFDIFFHECVMADFIDVTNKELANVIYQIIKQPQKKSIYYELYAPWSFYLQAGKQISIPTGFRPIMNEDVSLEYTESDSFKFVNKIRNNKHIIIKLTAKKNVCINEGDCLVKCELVVE